jgi:hypothetical protein
MILLFPTKTIFPNMLGVTFWTVHFFFNSIFPLLLHQRRKIKVGQKVRVKSGEIAGDLVGTVDRIGSQVMRQSVVNTDPSANIDARVVEVYATLDAASSKKAAKFTNLQVQMVIAQ